MTLVTDLPLRGAGGEPVDFARTIVSHGVAELPPNRLDLEARMLETTLPVPRGARTVRLTESAGKLRIEAVAGTVGEAARAALTKTVAHMFRLDEDLSGFYTLVGGDGELAWCARGAGRMLRAPTVFEDVVKTNRTLIRNLVRVRRPLPFSAPRSRRTG
jgi:3-methyladenine DNA glycosylase/8-oxoguanine DNA glycosylase